MFILLGVLLGFLLGAVFGVVIGFILSAAAIAKQQEREVIQAELIEA